MESNDDVEALGRSDEVDKIGFEGMALGVSADDDVALVTGAGVLDDADDDMRADAGVALMGRLGIWTGVLEIELELADVAAAGLAGAGERSALTGALAAGRDVAGVSAEDDGETPRRETDGTRGRLDEDEVRVSMRGVGEAGVSEEEEELGLSEAD